MNFPETLTQACTAVSDFRYVPCSYLPVWPRNVVSKDNWGSLQWLTKNAAVAGRTRVTEPQRVWPQTSHQPTRIYFQTAERRQSTRLCSRNCWWLIYMEAEVGTRESWGGQLQQAWRQENISRGREKELDCTASRASEERKKVFISCLAVSEITKNAELHNLKSGSPSFFMALLTGIANSNLSLQKARRSFMVMLRFIPFLQLVLPPPWRNNSLLWAIAGQLWVAYLLVLQPCQQPDCIAREPE